MLMLNVVTLGGDTIAEVRVSSRITVGELKHIVKEAVKEIIPARFRAHDLLYENTVLSLEMTLHASKIKDLSTLTYINKSQVDSESEEMPALTDSASDEMPGLSTDSASDR